MAITSWSISRTVSILGRFDCWQQQPGGSNRSAQHDDLDALVSGTKTAQRRLERTITRFYALPYLSLEGTLLYCFVELEALSHLFIKMRFRAPIMQMTKFNSKSLQIFSNKIHNFFTKLQFFTFII